MTVLSDWIEVRQRLRLAQAARQTMRNETASQPFKDGAAVIYRQHVEQLILHLQRLEETPVAPGPFAEPVMDAIERILGAIDLASAQGVGEVDE